MTEAAMSLDGKRVIVIGGRFGHRPCGCRALARIRPSVDVSHPPAEVVGSVCPVGVSAGKLGV